MTAPADLDLDALERRTAKRMNVVVPRDELLALLALARRTVAAEADADRYQRDRADALNVRSRDGLLSSEWLARTGKAERERDEARAALTLLLWRSIADDAACSCYAGDPCPECQAMAALGLDRWTVAEEATRALQTIGSTARDALPVLTREVLHGPRRAAADPEVDRVARLLMAEWERVEHKPVNVSYVATFADMARVVIAARPPLDPPHVEALRHVRDRLAQEMATLKASGAVYMVEDRQVQIAALDAALTAVLGETEPT